MRYIIPCVEQLDRAALELHYDNPVNSRLALILTDNIVELICHRRCEELIDCDGGDSWLDQPKYSAKQRCNALGRYFEQKIKFLRSAKLISEEEQEFALIAHCYRNKAYHIGLRDDAILWHVSWHYHSLACILFGRLRPSWQVSTSSDPYTDRVRYHFQKIGITTPWPVNAELDSLAQSIASERPDNEMPLGTALSKAILIELAEMEEQFEFLLSDNPNQINAESTLRRIQYHKAFMQKMEKSELYPSDQKYRDELRRVREIMDSSWTPKYTSIPLEKWRRRADSLARESCHLKALKKFEGIRKDKADLAEMIYETASELDAHIQMEVDRARGK